MRIMSTTVPEGEIRIPHALGSSGQATIGYDFNPKCKLDVMDLFDCFRLEENSVSQTTPSKHLATRYALYVALEFFCFLSSSHSCCLPFLSSSLPPFRNSDILLMVWSHSRHLSPTTVLALQFYRENSSALHCLVDSRRIVHVIQYTRCNMRYLLAGGSLKT